MNQDETVLPFPRNRGSTPAAMFSSPPGTCAQRHSEETQEWRINPAKLQRITMTAGTHAPSGTLETLKQHNRMKG